MSDLILIYIFGLLVVNSFLLLWFMSPLKTTISEVFLGKELLPLEFDDYVFSKSKFLGKLTTCFICSSFWTSLAVGVLLGFIFNLTLFWPVITFTSYPCLCYVFYTFIKK
jgi:hypothetical protein